MELIGIVVAIILIALFGFHVVVIPVVLAGCILFAPVIVMHWMARVLEPGWPRLRRFLTHHEAGAGVSVCFWGMVALAVMAAWT